MVTIESHNAVGQLVILSGPSGVGKDTVINEWARLNPRVVRVVAYTTRAPRNGEMGGVDYNFVSVDRFHELVKEGAFLEWKEVHGNFYATPLKDAEALLSQGKIAVLKIDVQGALSVMAMRPDAATIFILPPSDEELERRIRSRGLDDEEVIAKRLKNARGEVALSDHYKYRIVNDSLAKVLQELERLV